MKVLDWPPVWLILFMVLTWLAANLLPGWNIAFPAQNWIAICVVGAGIMMMVLAVVSMMRAHTTVIPRRQPSHLVKTGIFMLTRNPIYLGDALVLTGFIIWLGAIIAAPLIGVFVYLITRRFIVHEEEWIRRVFGEEFDIWANKTRRWL